MKLYKFSRTYVEKYIFEIEAKDEIAAWRKFENMEKEEAIGRQNMTITDHLEGEKEILEE